MTFIRRYIEMLRLIGFEIQRKWKMTMMALGAYFILMYIASLYVKKEIVEMGFQVLGGQSPDLPEVTMLIFFMGFGLIVVSVIDAVNNMRLELKRTSRDLYFSIPISSFQMLGAKLFVSVVEVLVALSLGLLSIFYALEKIIGYKFIGEMFDGIFEYFVNFSYLATEIALSVSLLILLVYVTFAIYRSFFSQFRFGGIITLVIYVIIMYLYFKYIGQYIELNFSNESTSTNLWVLGIWPLIASITSNVVLFGLTGYMLERRVNFD